MNLHKGLDDLDESIVDMQRKKEAEQEKAELVRLLRRYRSETPLGHQPHMIAGEVDAILAKHEQENQEDHETDTEIIPNPDYHGPGSKTHCCNKEDRDWNGTCKSCGAPGF